MKSFFATFYPASGTSSVEATLLVFERTLSIGYKNAAGANEMIKWFLKDTNASFEFSRQLSRLKNNRQPGEIHIEGKEAAAFINGLKNEEQKPWYKKENGKQWIRNSLLLTGILGLLFFIYLLIVPWLSEKMASNVSVKMEQQFGDAVYDAMGLTGREDKKASLLLNDFFYSMEITTPYSVRVSVVKDNTVNAFALPGGRIVVYDALLKKIENYPELAALLCHEFTHVNNKHSTKSIFRRLGSQVFLGLLFGRFGTVTSVLVNHADNLKSLTYSRGLEKEADMEGLSLLIQRKINPEGFVTLFTTLKNSSSSDILPEFLGSHPDIDKRIAYIRKASKGVILSDNLQLKAIFEKIKQ
jgi:Zn-dependent protease with chaperone function